MSRFARQVRRRRDLGVSRSALRELRAAVQGEGVELARKVVAGEYTRAQIVEMWSNTHDAEPAVALDLLTEWGYDGP